MTKLSENQQRLFDALSPPDRDVSISSLFATIYGCKGVLRKAHSDWTNRQKQQKLGYLIAKLNEKLPKGKVEPGVLKQTYRLSTKPASCKD